MYRDLDRNAPMFLQIYDKIKKDILCAKYPPNAQIPTVRQLACDMSVNPNTVQRALQLLEEERLVVARATLGRFVTPDTLRIKELKHQMQIETLRSWIVELRGLDITVDDIIEFINNEGGNV
jgi:DNA-binding transcriptional regulator YhcF (GntR family)